MKLLLPLTVCEYLMQSKGILCHKFLFKKNLVLLRKISKDVEHTLGIFRVNCQILHDTMSTSLW